MQERGKKFLEIASKIEKARGQILEATPTHIQLSEVTKAIGLLDESINKLKISIDHNDRRIRFYTVLLLILTAYLAIIGILSLSDIISYTILLIPCWILTISILLIFAYYLYDEWKCKKLK